ncbi:MAG: methyltransferase domain-containing protein [Acidobacteria bacterium]|nr:MAG: methyltransferase domain-containing protein [Acidobacteriota bacterium]
MTPSPPSRPFARFALALMLSLPAALAAQEPQPSPPPHRHPHDAAAEHRHHQAHHDFSDAERWSAVFDDPARDAWQKPAEVVALMALAPGMTVVDLGSGTGYFLPHLSRAVGDGGRVLALEPEPNLVRFIEQRAAREGWTNVEARRIPYDDPELAPASADRILIVNTWHHIAERPAYAAKLRAALAPGGRVYVVDFTKDSPSGPPPAERLDPEQVVDELKAGGLDAELIPETLPRQYVVAARRPD